MWTSGSSRIKFAIRAAERILKERVAARAEKRRRFFIAESEIESGVGGMDGSKVLIVDDDPELVTLVGSWLRKVGCEVVCAEDAIGAISQAQRECPDVILLDLGLPAGGGHVALERLKRNPRTAATPVIVLTASERRSDHVKASELGATTVLPKAGGKADLLSAVESSIGSGQVADHFPTPRAQR